MSVSLSTAIQTPVIKGEMNGIAIALISDVYQCSSLSLKAN